MFRPLLLWTIQQHSHMVENVPTPNAVLFLDHQISALKNTLQEKHVQHDDGRLRSGLNIWNDNLDLGMLEQRHIIAEPDLAVFDDAFNR
jgi:hypothetical protein